MIDNQVSYSFNSVRQRLGPTYLVYNILSIYVSWIVDTIQRFGDIQGFLCAGEIVFPSIGDNLVQLIPEPRERMTIAPPAYEGRTSGVFKAAATVSVTFARRCRKPGKTLSGASGSGSHSVLSSQFTVHGSRFRVQSSGFAKSVSIGVIKKPEIPTMNVGIRNQTGTDYLRMLEWRKFIFH